MPRVIRRFLSQNELMALNEFFDNHQSKRIKSTGPVTVDIEALKTEKAQWGELEAKIVSRLKSPFRLLGGNFFYVNKPHIIHTDGEDGQPITHDTFVILLPLREQFSPSVVCKEHYLVIFKQTCFDAPKKFVLGDDPSRFPVASYSYSANPREIDDLSNEKIADEHCKLLSHLRIHWLNGLSVDSLIEWRPGDLIMFPAAHLHCSSDFRQVGVEAKLGLSLFVEILPPSIRK